MALDRKDIELLAPAKNLECGLAAISHGADAVYIGAPSFGARHAAGNTVADIGKLVEQAHLYGARVHVTMNTLLTDQEVAQAKQLAWQLHEVGVDVLIVQDMALLGDGMPPMELHASTQCDNRTAAKVEFWQRMGLRQAVLARELSVEQIAGIARHTAQVANGEPPIRLEAFVHGALCVSLSGQCYMSLCDGGRSANRGECAQPCRLKYELRSADGQKMAVGAAKHLLSLKDNNQTPNLEALMLAGVSSFKIEGRLKDADYVANVTMHYRQQIDQVLARHPEFRRLAVGKVNASFAADPCKSFNRGFTTYFANGRQTDIWQPATPKSLGEPLGRAHAVKGNTLCVTCQSVINNGDGLCYITRDGRFGGMKVNTAKMVNGKAQGGQKWLIYAQNLRGLQDGDMVYRNYDAAFDAELKHDKTTRTVGLKMRLEYDAATESMTLHLTDEEGLQSATTRSIRSDEAQNPYSVRENMERTMRKLGGTPYEATQVEIEDEATKRFAPAAELNALRRDALAAHTLMRTEHHKPAECHRTEVPNTQYVAKELKRDANVTNREAKEFYEKHGATVTEMGYETHKDNRGQRVMTTRHCLMHATGHCLRQHPENKKMLPLTLTSENGKQYEVTTDCRECMMLIFCK